ncbi:MAG: DUF6732 family protein [Hyphomicrobiales bacterium]
MNSISFAISSMFIALAGQAMAHPGHGAATANHDHWAFYAAGLFAVAVVGIYLRAKRS